MTAVDTEALIRALKSAFKNRKNSSSGRPDDAASSSNLQSTLGTSKSIVDTVVHRENGNRLYEKRKFRQAVISYTKSVATAPEDSEALRKAYGNRSAALFELEEYDECCLLDVNRALKDCSSYAVKERLLDRKKRCLNRIKSSAGANYVSEIGEDATNPPPVQEPIWRADMLSKFGNPLLPNASPKIKLKHDEKWGRHFVATADIEPGEPLIIEEYFAVVTGKDELVRFQFCDFCVSQCQALIPCTSCASMLYCSEGCREKAYDKYHKMECKLLRVLPTIDEPHGSPIDTIAVRLFLVGTEQGAALENLMNNWSVPDIFEENYNFADKPFTSDYMAALRLKVTLSESISAECIENAVEVITELRKLAFFKSVSDNRLEDDVDVFATALLLNNSRRRYMNTFTVVVDEVKEVEMCEGLLLLQNLMNHSCHPNVEYFPRKRDTIMCSARPIKKDEQLFFCYHQNFECCSKPERILGHTGFICECEACNENWPPAVSVTLPSPEALFVIKESLLPKEEGFELLFAKLLNTSAPLLDDTALVNLEVCEIVSTIAEIVSLLYKVMKPMSYPVIVLRFFLVQFIEIFYEERERDLSLNGKLNFASSTALGLNDDELQSILPTDSCHKEATIKMYYVICRLNFYMENGHFVYSRNIVG